MKRTAKILSFIFLLMQSTACQQIDDDMLKEAQLVRLTLTANTYQITEVNQWEHGDSSDFILNGEESRVSTAQQPVKRMAFILLNERGEKTISQEKTCSDASYMTLSAEVPSGAYRVIAFAHNGESNASVSTRGIITPPEEKLTDSFLYYKEINLKSETTEQSITLDRCVAKFSLKHTDAIPASTSRIEMEFSQGGNTIDASTGLSANNEGYSVSINIPASAAGTKNNLFSAFLSLPEKECTLDVSIKARDTNGDIVSSHLFENLPMEINTQTICTGAFFKQNQSFTATLNTEWASSKEFNF